MNRTGYSELPGKKWEWKHCEVLRMEIGHEKSVQWKLEIVGWNMKEMKELQEVSNRYFWKMEMWKWKMNENIVNCLERNENENIVKFWEWK
jgi:hypothetical protein